MIDWLGHHVTDFDAAALERASTFWQYRFDAAAAGDEGSKTELRGFGWWFASGQLDAEWSLRQLLSVLAAVDLRGSDQPTLRQLGVLAGSHPVLCLQAVQAWLASLSPEGAATGYLVSTAEIALRQIIDTAVTSSSTPVTEHVAKIVSLAFRRGLDLRDLL